MDGIIIINKPKEYTSHDVVAKVKKILNLKKVGHTGTLDPNATGVLPLLLDSGTKISKYLIEHDKEYEVTLKLGIKTDTADIEGKIIEEDKEFLLNNIKDEEIEKALKTMLGKIEQIPPMYSAIKVNGKKLYEYARNGQVIDITPRKIQIYDIKLQKMNKKDNEILFKVSCSKGTYIRSLCEDIASNLNTVGYMKELNRTKVGRFYIEDSITIEELENNKDKIKEKIITIEKIFEDKEKIVLENDKLEYFLNGVKMTVKKEDGIYNIYKANEQYIGLGIIKDNKLKRDVII